MQQAAPNVEELFFAALELEGSEARSAFLDRYCTDTELRRRVEELLDGDAQGSDFLEAPASILKVTVAHDSRSGVEEPGTVIGPYKLMEAIGEGGMGTVYMAEQGQPVRRRVALKVIKPGMDSKQVVARFEAERQALAMMDHPNIAKVHDAGTTPSGRPYFVMELVRGVPITEYCDREQLSIPERLELFVLVCRAVQHAHQKGIIHRDLKPSNVLVTVIDGVAVPKVIDFGVAKATGQSLTDKTLFTGFHQFVGTPLYMSPEQADVSGMDVDTRSDIYALGVLLYELLTGTTPFDQETFRKAAFDELRWIIREQEPPKPSTRLSSLGATRATVSANRKSDQRQLDRAVRGELDWIVMKALEKDRRRRYETANDFAADVMNYLTDRPVEACPPSAWYRFTKYARRHRAALTTSTLVAGALIAGTGLSLWQARKARAAAAEARLRADESKQVIDYLTKDVFGATAPGKGRGRSATVGELLDQADATVAARFRGQPLVEASVRMALAESYSYIMDGSRAERHATRAAELRERHLGPAHPATLEALAEQAWLLCLAGWTGGSDGPAKSAEPIGRRVLDARRRVLGPTHPDTLWSQTVLAITISHRGRQEEAEPLAAQAEQLAVRALGPEHETTLVARHFLGLIVERQGDLARAEALLRQVLGDHERILGILNWRTLNALKDLAVVVRKRGQNDEARRLYLEIIDRYNRVFGLSHPQTSPLLGLLLDLLRSERDYAAIRDLCERWLREVLASPVEPDPYQQYQRSVRLGGLAVRLVTLPDPIPFDADLALHAAEEAVTLHGDMEDAWTSLAVVYYRLGRLDDAMRALQSSMASPRQKGGDDYDWLVLALIYARRGELDRARAWYDKARDRETPAVHHSDDIRPLLEEAEALIPSGPPSTARSQD